MKCFKCNKNVLTFRKVEKDGTKYLCYECVKAENSEKETKEPLVPVYTMVWRLEDEEGTEYIQRFEDVCLADIEALYGGNSDKIIWIKFWMKGRAMV